MGTLNGQAFGGIVIDPIQLLASQREITLLPSMQFIVGNARRRCVFCCLDLGRRFQQLARPRIFDDLIRDDLKSRQSSRTESS